MSRRAGAALAVLAVVAALAGCAQPGTQASKAQAARIAVATSDISTACGYAEEVTAFAGPHAHGLSSVRAMAQKGAHKLAGVYAQNQTGIYQGESIGGVVNDSIALLGDCGLPGPRRVLEHALTAHP